MRLSRRTLLASAAALSGSLALPGSLSRAFAQSSDFLILSHRIHQVVSTDIQGGDITAAWRERNGRTIEWLTFDQGPLQERLLREASLNATDIDIAFMLNPWANPSVIRLLEPLDPFMAEEPIEDFGDFFPGPIQAMTFDGQLYGIPFRHATAGLHYNAELFEERGLSGPPRTVEELAEYAKQLTYTRGDGTQVVGLILPNNYSNIVHLSRAWDGDFVTADYRVAANEPPMVKTITMLRDLFEAGAFPRDFPALFQDETTTWMQTGRAAMVITNMSRNALFNHPEQSRFPGRIVTTTVPIAAELSDRFEAAPVGTEFWSMTIPRNAQEKALSWSLMREMMTKENVRRAALNGNGPMRSSLYADPDYLAAVPYAEAEHKALSVARVALPAFEGAPLAADFIREEYEAALLGFKEPQEAMDDLAARLQPLMPQ